MFLGVESTFGDDRSLTNCVLREWKVRYEEKAVSHTIVPETFQQFMKQQTRWKRSWTRESLIVATFIWKKNPIAAIATYISVVLPLVAPIAALRAVVVEPLMHGSGAPVVYLARHLRDRAGVRAVLRLPPAPLRHALAVGHPVRLLLPGVPALADLLRDPHVAHAVLGHARPPSRPRWRHEPPRPRSSATRPGPSRPSSCRSRSSRSC